MSLCSHSDNIKLQQQQTIPFDLKLKTKIYLNRPFLVLKAYKNTTRIENRNENGLKSTSTAPVSLKKGTRNNTALNR